LKYARLFIFFTLFLAVLGLSILFPVQGPLVRELGLDETDAGWFGTAYSLAQLIASPLWGAISERLGRKPILVLGNIGFALGFGLFALGAHLGLDGTLGGPALFTFLLVSRVIGGGLSAAVFPTAAAYMADVSSNENRAAAMGLVGAAFGLGIIFGPVLGAVLAQQGFLVPLVVSSVLGLVAAAFAWFKLAETRTQATRDRARVGGLFGARDLAARRPVLILLGVSLVFTFGLVLMEATVAFLVQDVMDVRGVASTRTIGVILSVNGLTSAIVQGGGIRPLNRRFGEARLVWIGLAVAAAGLFLLSAAGSMGGFVVAMVVLGLGGALVSPSVASALSLAAHEGEQGPLAGFNSSAMALGRMLGPIVGTGLYQHVGRAAPYQVAALLVLLLCGAAVAFVRPAKRPGIA